VICDAQGKDAFGRAGLDVFQFACQGVGQMQMLRISHNNTGAHPNWHLDKVVGTPVPISQCLASVSNASQKISHVCLDILQQF